MKIKVLITSLIGLVILVGCSSKQSIHNLTPNQKELLSKISFNEEKVYSGDLAAWQEEVLQQYDFCMEYLANKYPSHSFEFIDCDPKNKFNSYSTFGFTADGNANEPYELYLYIDNGYSCEDNFYSSLLEPKYENGLLELINSEVLGCIGIRSTMGSVQGVEIGEGFDVQRLLTGDVQIVNNTILFFDRNLVVDQEEVFSQVKSFINDNNLYGHYVVIVLTSFPDEFNNGDDLWEFVKANGESVYSFRNDFNTW